MQSYFFNLSVPYLKCEDLYRGGNHSVVLESDQGINVQIPAINLRPFITSQGIKGRFRLIIDDRKKVKSFEKIS